MNKVVMMPPFGHERPIGAKTVVGRRGGGTKKNYGSGEEISVVVGVLFWW